MSQRNVSGSQQLPGDLISNEPERHTNPERVGDLIRSLNAEVPGRRSAAIEGLSLALRFPMHSEFREIVGYNLVDKLADPDHDLRRRAILAVSDAGAICAEPSARRLCQIAERDDLSSAEEKSAILEALMRLEGLNDLRPELAFEFQQSLCDLAKDDANSAVRAWACRAIGFGNFKVDGGEAVLRDVQNSDPVSHVREWAAAALSQISKN